MPPGGARGSGRCCPGTSTSEDLEVEGSRVLLSSSGIFRMQWLFLRANTGPAPTSRRYPPKCGPQTHVQHPRTGFRVHGLFIFYSKCAGAAQMDPDGFCKLRMRVHSLFGEAVTTSTPDQAPENPGKAPSLTPKPCTLNSKLHRKLQTLHPKLQTLHPKLQTLHPKL